MMMIEKCLLNLRLYEEVCDYSEEILDCDGRNLEALPIKSGSEYYFVYSGEATSEYVKKNVDILTIFVFRLVIDTFVLSKLHCWHTPNKG